MNSLCSVCGRSFTHDDKLAPAPICSRCAAATVLSTARDNPGQNSFLSTEYCSGCGETIRPHWTTCPVCQSPLHGQSPPQSGELKSIDNPFSPPVRVEKEARHDLLWAGIAMICLAVTGLAGIVMSFVRGGMAARSEDRLLGFGIIVFAAMVGGGLVGASKKKEGSVAKGVLLGLMGSLGAIFLVMAIIVLLVVCFVIFLIVTCMTSINH